MLAPATVGASSHREAPYITERPKVDATDLYLFNSYETGRDQYVTLLANFQPLQDPYGGPNYFTMDPDALYEIHVDNNGDAIEDITFRFDFDMNLAGGSGIALDVGPSGATKSIAVPFTAIGPISAGNDAGQNVIETYKLKVVRGDRRTGQVSAVKHHNGSDVFRKPLDNIGPKTIPNYPAYAAKFMYDVELPGCTAGMARVFVGQRKEGFSVNVGQIFDTLNLEPAGTDRVANVLGAQEQGANDLEHKNVTTIAVEVPKACLTKDASTPIIGAWITASVRQAEVVDPTPSFEKPARVGGPWVQVSRLGMPLVNEIIIGLKDKNLFNAAEPKDDAKLADYVTHPTLPEVVEIAFGGAGVRAPNNFPRTDLVAAFLTGVPDVNANGSTAEMQRLNTAIPATTCTAQSPYGASGCFDDPTATENAKLDTTNEDCDPAGFPNGRRPGDDVVDIELRVAMGALVNRTDAPSGGCLHADSTGCLPYVDGAGTNAMKFRTSFPYLNTPIPGAP
ncbi:MAG: DUF4331 domain-containing protein [Deltaproteobacteria bacterium]|nr:DUF4331 domain-containing protein [Deltaproteobacteria bacterium]MDQ3298152.1 DUF4331 domain-containing protein [Myxococcota bacterium]